MTTGNEEFFLLDAKADMAAVDQIRALARERGASFFDVFELHVKEQLCSEQKGRCMPLALDDVSKKEVI